MAQGIVNNLKKDSMLKHSKAQRHILNLKKAKEQPLVKCVKKARVTFTNELRMEMNVKVMYVLLSKLVTPIDI